jgi:RNA polymerase sigma factor (sigma-70 family)
MTVPSQARPGRHLRVLRPLRRHSDVRLVELARRGDEDAFSCLVDRYRRELLIYAHRLLGAESRSEDALQQALFGAWLALRDQDREVDNPRAWLYRCVHNAAVTILRRAQHETITLEDARDAGAATPGADRRTELSTVITELGRLPETERRALIMTSVSGASHEEAAETLGVSRAAVRGMVYRARTSLRTAVGGLMPWPAWNWLSNLTSGGSGEGVGAAAGSAGLGAAVLKGGAVIAALGAVSVAGDKVLVPHHSTSHGVSAKVALIGRDASDSRAPSSSRHARGAATRNAPSHVAANSTPAASSAAPDRGDRPGSQPGRPAGSPGRDERHHHDGRHGAAGRHDGEHHGGRSGTGSTPGGPGHAGRGGHRGPPTTTSPTSGPPTTTSPTSGPPTTTSPRSGPPTTIQPTSGPPTTSSPGGPPTSTTSTRGGSDDPGGDDHGTTTSGAPTTTTGVGHTDDGSGSGRPVGAGKTAATGKTQGDSGTVTVASTPPPVATTTVTAPTTPTTTSVSTPTTTAVSTPTTSTTTSTSTTPDSDGGGDGRSDGR